MPIKSEETIRAEIEEKFNELGEIEKSQTLNQEEKEHRKHRIHVEIGTLSWVLGEESGLDY